MSEKPGDYTAKAPNPTVTEMVAAYLTEYGYDGLYCDDCGCGVDDLAPCESLCGDCRAGYRRGQPGGKFGRFFGPDRVIAAPEAPQSRNWEEVAKRMALAIDDRGGCPPTEKHSGRKCPDEELTCANCWLKWAKEGEE